MQAPTISFHLKNLLDMDDRILTFGSAIWFTVHPSKAIGRGEILKEMTDKRRRMERAAGTSGLNMLDVKVVVDWLERETGADLTSAHQRRRKSRNPNAVNMAVAVLGAGREGQVV